MAKKTPEGEVQPVLDSGAGTTVEFVPEFIPNYRIPVKQACLHTPFFMSGVNYGEKLGSKDVKTEKPLEMEWCKEQDGIIAIDRGRKVASVIPRTSIASWTPKNFADIGVEFAPDAPKPVLPVVKPEVVRAQHLNPMAGPAPTPRNPAQVENPTQPQAGRARNAA